MKFLKLIAILVFLSILPGNTQIIRTKLDATLGISAREYVHVGLRYQYSDITQVGLSYGGDLGIRPNEIITTYSLDHMIHFGKLSFNSNRPVWYARQGLTYSDNLVDDKTTYNYTYLNLSLGREFAVNNWLGFNADLGFIAQLNQKTNGDAALGSPNRMFYTYPLARIQAFISF